MDNFEQYLLSLKMNTSTIKSYCYNVNLFIQWVEKENHLDTGSIGYNELLAYIQYEKQKNVSPATINIRLTSIAHYFDYLKKMGEVKSNPARLLRVKGTIERVIENPLNAEELRELYANYKLLKKVSQHQHITDMVHQRNVVMLGLMVFQGVHSGELQKMEVGHITLGAGTVYMPSTSRGNNRTLQLLPVQILTIHEYLEQTRLQLKPKAEELFPGNLHNTIYLLVQELQGINPSKTNAMHIRGSVIINWLKQHNKRQVQYLAGHKYISSTEAYAVQDLDTLQDELSKHHPFG